MSIHSIACHFKPQMSNAHATCCCVTTHVGGWRRKSYCSNGRSIPVGEHVGWIIAKCIERTAASLLTTETGTAHKSLGEAPQLKCHGDVVEHEGYNQDLYRVDEPTLKCDRKTGRRGEVRDASCLADGVDEECCCGSCSIQKLTLLLYKQYVRVDNLWVNNFRLIYSCFCRIYSY